MANLRRNLCAVLIIAAIVGAFVAGIVVANRLDSLWRPPNSKTLVRRLSNSGNLDFIEQTGHRYLANAPISADERKRLQGAGVNAVEQFPDAKAPRAVRFEFGGADNHYGLLVTREADAPAIGYTVTPLKPNVWYYSEIPPRR